MDKHDRPCKCAHKGCEKLQGFTYSGGPLCHEMRKSTKCTEEQRSLCSGPMPTGSEARSENLAEHLRSVHRNVDRPMQLLELSLQPVQPLTSRLLSQLPPGKPRSCPFRVKARCSSADRCDGSQLEWGCRLEGETNVD